jgi:hypothetical protein
MRYSRKRRSCGRTCWRRGAPPCGSKRKATFWSRKVSILSERVWWLAAPGALTLGSRTAAFFSLSRRGQLRGRPSTRTAAARARGALAAAQRCGSEVARQKAAAGEVQRTIKGDDKKKGLIAPICVTVSDGPRRHRAFSRRALHPRPLRSPRVLVFPPFSCRAPCSLLSFAAADDRQTRPPRAICAIDDHAAASTALRRRRAGWRLR